MAQYLPVVTNGSSDPKWQGEAYPAGTAYPDGKPWVIVENQKGPYGPARSRVCRGIGGHSRTEDFVMTFNTKEDAEEFMATMKDPYAGFDPTKGESNIYYTVQKWG